MKMLLTCGAMVGLLLGFLSGQALAGTPCSDARLQQAEVSAERHFPGWKVVSLADLSDDDRKLWQDVHHDACPGIAMGNFGGDGVVRAAVTLIRRKKSGRYQMLLVGTATGWEMLAKPEVVDRISVVRAIAGGGSFSGSDALATPAPHAIGFEALEAGMLLYAWDGGKYVQVQASE